MFESVLRVKYVNVKTCFVYLSHKHTNLDTGICIKLNYDEKNVAYFSANIVQNIVDTDCIGINSSYAKLLGIKENDFVNVSHIEQLPVVNSISIQAFNKSDHEILELLAQNVQSNLLDQVRVVNSGQNLVIWIGSNISVNVFIDKVQPISPGVLDFLTEVVITTPDNTEKNKFKDIHKNPSEDQEYIKNFRQFLKKNVSETDNLSSLDKVLEFNKNLYYRLVPLSELPNFNAKIVAPFTVYVPKNSQYKNDFHNTDNSFFYTMILLNSPYIVKKLHVKLCFLEDIFNIDNEEFLANNSCNIFVNNSVLNFMQCEIGARVVLKKITKVPYVKEIEVHSKKNYGVNVVEKLKIYLSDNCKSPLILNADFPLEIDEKLFCSLKFQPNSSEFCLFDTEFLRNCSYKLSDNEVVPLEQALKKDDFNDNFCVDISPAKDACDNLFSVFCVNNKYKAEHAIFTGKTGMGKTSFLNHITKIFRGYPYFVNTERVDCKSIKGKTVDSLHKFLTDIFIKLIFTQPSLLLCDDLHVLCESCEGEETPNSIYFNRVSEMLCGLFSVISRHNSVGILATAESVSKLNKNLYRSRGNHMFKNVFAIEDLTKDDRIVLLKHFFSKHLVDSNVDYAELSIKTDGFVIQDIEDFYKKVLFEAYKEPRNEDEPTINQEHCDIALKKSCALSLQNVKFHSAGSKTFDDIGGLHKVKNILIESLLWPVKYSAIFAKAPLRLQSGLLLYGPPGTGKTLLAGAAAKQCSLRLISIKGPELLSKYIGASEQAVRDVFEKAQRAKPCILFFDEFDSLAPRRGHDNTGVTDRVVNQLLTQLDGVEALTGVCVLAATSRPDLLDPALLRPGRLDKQLLCPMPNETDRLEILQILSKSLDLSNDVDFIFLAENTDGFSGADLQSLLYTSQISSIRDFDTDDGNNQPVVSKITQECLLAALEKTRPSLTRSERIKYERIYSKFEGGNVEDFKAGSKVTLA